MEFLKGFDNNDKSRPVISAVIKMAKDIGMSTLSEGVETEKQAKFLKDIGCVRLQGYLFGKPMPIEELEEKVNNGEYIIASNCFE